MLENASEVTLVQKSIFFLDIFNFVQSFVECKVSLADGTFHFNYPLYAAIHQPFDVRDLNFHALFENTGRHGVSFHCTK
jgi:hypothetical protein